MRESRALWGAHGHAQGSVVFRLVAPDVARTALVGALTDAGLEDLASVVLKHKPPADAGGEDGAGKKGKKRRRGKGGQGDDSEPEGGKKRKRQISLMNLFTPFIFEAIQKVRSASSSSGTFLLRGSAPG